jgi:hypothetical protein
MVWKAQQARPRVWTGANLEVTLSGLSSRVFLLHNTHDDFPVLMATRWTLSYLRGPLSRDQIRLLMAPVKNAPLNKKEDQAAASQPAGYPETPHSLPGQTSQCAAQAAPTLPPDIPQYFLPLRGADARRVQPGILPHLYGAARVAFADTKSRTSTVQAHQYLTPISDTAVPVDWHNAQKVEIAPASWKSSRLLFLPAHPGFHRFLLKLARYELHRLAA